MEYIFAKNSPKESQQTDNDTKQPSLMTNQSYNFKGPNLACCTKYKAHSLQKERDFSLKMYPV